MRFNVPEADARKNDGRTFVVTDLDSGNPAGNITTGKGVSCCMGTVRFYTRRISLLGKYHGGFDSHAECVAFAKGVEAVLNHMMEHELPEQKMDAA
jgi:hypothetical protein